MRFTNRRRTTDDLSAERHACTMAVHGTEPSPPLTSPRSGWWRGHTRLRALLYVCALLLAGVVSAIASASDHKSTSVDSATGGESVAPRHSGETQPSAPSAHRPAEPSDGRRGDQDADPGSGQLLDQPVPVPGYRWRGWTRYPNGRCAWLSPVLAGQLGAADVPQSHPSGCLVTTRDGTRLRITWGEPQTRAAWYQDGDLVAVAGLESQVFQPFFLRLVFPSACLIHVNTGGVSGLTLFAWRPDIAETVCATARTAATSLVRSFVVKAGGAPWRDAPQKPDVSSAVGRGPCSLLVAGMAHYVELDGVPLLTRIEESGESCEVSQRGVHVRAWLRLPSEDISPADTSPGSTRAEVRRLGQMAAVESRTADSCAITTEVLPGHVFGIQYRARGADSPDCRAAELIAATAVQTLLDRTVA